MDATKFILKSKTLLGIVIAAVPVVLNLFGVEASTEDVKTIGDSIIGIITEFQSVIELGGLAFAAYGRIKANTSLKLKPTA